jgi:predicted permease
MRQLRALWTRFCGMFGRARAEDEFSAELESHLQMHIEDNLRFGMSAEEARRDALIKLGGIEQTKQAHREREGLPWLDIIWQDIRFGMRMLRKNPRFTAIAVLTLTLGIGANTAIFSIVNGVLLNPLPFPHPEQLIFLHESKPNFETGSISLPNFQDWRKDNHTFSTISAFRGYYFGLTGMGPAEQLDGQFMTSDFFETLGVKPILGRTFTRAEELPGSGPVVIISQGLWQRKFGSSPDVLGKGIMLEGKNYTIIGVVPASFRISVFNLRNRDVYVPIGQWKNPVLNNRDAGLGIRAIARLKPGVSIEQAKADMQRVTANLTRAFPDVDKDVSAKLIPLKEQMVGDVRPLLMVLLAAVGFVLLIACVNVASLMLARFTGRMREFAVRAALGASRTRVIRQLLTESLMLATAGGSLGLLLAVFGTRTGLKFLPTALPRADEIGLDCRVLLFTIAISLVAGVLFGLVPALKMSQAAPHSALKEGGRGASTARHRTQSIFVITEMAIALVLLIGAGLMVRSLAQLWNVNPGFNPHNVLTFGYTLPPSLLHGDPDTIRTVYHEFDNKLAAVPGIRSVSQSWGSMPFNGDDERFFWREGQPKPDAKNQMPMALNYIVGPDYLKVMDVPLKRGRFFTEHDDAKSPPVAIIDDTFARKYFPDEDPIGKRIVLDGATDRKLEIIGVVGHVKQWGLDALLDSKFPLQAQLYTPWMQAPDSFVQMAPGGINAMVRYSGTSVDTVAAIRHILDQMSGQQIMYDPQTMDSIISDSLADRRFAMILLGAFAALALLLASVGIYGVIAYVVEQRTQEIGIRMALGAQRTDVLRMMLWQGTRLALAGIASGIVSALLLTRLMSKLLYGVNATDPLTFTAVTALLVLVALAACFLPARRATRIDPMQALRAE